ncbi:class I SAM-dependent methyltransferase [Apilactobacillus micheneri]|uniref:Class I SAM-dependent methyltransferase n=2 Tax=Apilactobacillus micheneri TaxID=1899430 RepID=A0A9Q8IMG4_9LACO|nr:class I SAM-dependent methyltransferase [Apilactobacillus micheneri]TPR43788.1 class I SAM-dependent methyltransferase [Apilactobacillus micheneri]TPR45341.1 class I SAM-dependent methyltransferase [Apilactobacillus micheneri]TPR51036.1 class I SAM-dependent methyltransferase [Apilactobacillus micheneri]
MLSLGYKIDSKGYIIIMNKIINWVKHWYRYKTDEPYIIALSFIGAFCLYGSIYFDHKNKSMIYVLILILLGLWTLLRTVTFKKNYINQFVDNHDFTASSKGLDLGTGTGYALIKMAKDNHLAEVDGVEDVYQYSIQRLEKNSTLEDVKEKVQLKAHDITSIPYDDNSFDVATAIHGRDDQLSNRKKSVYQPISKELNRVVKPGGVIFMLNTPGMIKRFKKDFEAKGASVKYMHRRFELFFNVRAIVITVK